MNVDCSIRFRPRPGEDRGGRIAVHRKRNRAGPRMKSYVVTGGAGFIGSALVRALLARGDGQVRVIDNLLTGQEKNLDLVRPRIAFDHCDIRDYNAVAAAVSDAVVVFHLAAIPSVPRSIREPVPSHEVNVDGTFNASWMAGPSTPPLAIPLREAPLRMTELKQSITYA